MKTRHPITRRHAISRGGFLKLAGTGSLALLAGACSTAAPAPTAPPATRPAPAQKADVKPTLEKVVIGTEAPATKTSNPGGAGNSISSAYFWPVFDGLTWLDRDGKLQPGLATEWKSVDPLTWEFALRRDVKFQDGTPLEAADVAGTFNYYRNVENKLQTLTLFVTVDKVEAPSPVTVRIMTKDVDPTLPKKIALAFVIPWRKIEKTGIEEYVKAPIGTGPYRWVSFDWNNGLKYQAMPPDFVTPRGPATIKEIEIRFLHEVAVRMGALKTGEIDIAERIPADAADAAKADGFIVGIDPGSSALGYILDTREGPTKDIRVRHALNYGVDKEAILKNLLRGFGELNTVLIGKEVLGYSPDLKPYPYDPERAKQLLAEAGYPNGFDTTITAGQVTQYNKDVAEAVAAHLKRVSVNVTINVVEQAAHASAAIGPWEKRKGLFPNLITWDRTFEPEPVWTYFSVSDFPPDRGGKWTDPTFDKLFQAARRESDIQKRAQAYQAAGKYLHEQAPVLFMWRPPRLTAMNKKLNWQPGYFADMYRRMVPAG